MHQSANTSPYTSSLWYTAAMQSREGEAATAAAAAAEPARAVAEEAPQEGGEGASAAADRGGKSTSTSPAPPASPPTVKERQIPVDPASLRRLGMVADEDSPLSAPSVLTELVVQSPALPPLRRPTFVGASLPCSAASSPVHGAGGARPAGAKWVEQPAATHCSPTTTAALRSLARQHSAALARLVAAPPPPSTLSRSASRAEGRTMAPHDDDDEEPEPVQSKTLAAADDGGGFMCGALCMLFPGFFSKRKPAGGTTTAGGTTAVSSSSVQRQQQSGLMRPRRSGASRVASLERFECGSWSPPPPPPAVAVDCHATEVAKISCAYDGDDAEAPVKMVFVFDGEPTPAAEGATRGILKNSASSRLDSTRPSTSSSSQRHVRFSTAVAADAAAASCPTSPCVTPRLERARAEFHAFLEAQSA